MTTVLTTLTLEYRIIGEFGIIGGLKSFPKINNRGVGKSSLQYSRLQE